MPFFPSFFFPCSLLFSSPHFFVYFFILSIMKFVSAFPHCFVFISFPPSNPLFSFSSSCSSFPPTFFYCFFSLSFLPSPHIRLSRSGMRSCARDSSLQTQKFFHFQTDTRSLLPSRTHTPSPLMEKWAWLAFVVGLRKHAEWAFNGWKRPLYMCLVSPLEQSVELLFILAGLPWLCSDERNFVWSVGDLTELLLFTKDKEREALFLEWWRKVVADAPNSKKFILSFGWRQFEFKLSDNLDVVILCQPVTFIKEMTATDTPV